MATKSRGPRKTSERTPARQVRFEATIHQGDQERALSQCRRPRPRPGTRSTRRRPAARQQRRVVALLERGYEVRLYRSLRAEPLSPDLASATTRRSLARGARAGHPTRGGSPDVSQGGAARRPDQPPRHAGSRATSRGSRCPSPPCRAVRCSPCGLRAGGGGERRGVLLVGGTHARELMNPDAIIELAVDLFVSQSTAATSRTAAHVAGRGHQADPRDAGSVARALHEPRRSRVRHDRGRPVAQEPPRQPGNRPATGSTSTATSTCSGG